MKKFLSIIQIFSLFLLLFLFQPNTKIEGINLSVQTNIQTASVAQKSSNNSPTISLSLEVFASGQIVQSVDFSIWQEFLSQNAKSLKEEMEFKKGLQLQVEGIRNEFLFSVALKYLQNPIEEYKINQGVALSPVSLAEDGKTMGFKILFSGAGAWNYYHDITPSSSPQKGNIFINKLQSQGEFPFSASIQISENQTISVGERYKEKYIASAEGLSFSQKLKEEYSPIFVYTYSTFNQKLHSNADSTFVNANGNLSHSWQCQNLADGREISLCQYVINKGVWLIFAISIPLAGMAVAITVIKLREGKNKGYFRA